MKFAVISDTHFVVPGTYPDGVWWNKTIYSLAEQRYDSIIRSVSAMNPDFAVVCGDFCGDCSPDSFLLGKKYMDMLPCGWRTAVGNHDTNRPGVREEISKLYRLPVNINYHACDLSDGKHTLHFMFLDLCQHVWRDGVIRPYVDPEAYAHGDILKFGIDDDQFAWIENELELNKENNIIIVTHTPVYYKDEVFIGTLPKDLERYDGYHPLNKLNPELEEKSSDCLKTLIKKFKFSIKAVFSGHTHINEVIYHDGIPFCTTGALRECPFEFRMAEIKNGYLYITTHRLDDPSLYDASYEKWRGNDWINGQESDRFFRIRL